MRGLLGFISTHSCTGNDELLLGTALVVLRAKIAPNLVNHVHLPLLEARPQAQLAVLAQRGVKLVVDWQIGRVEVLLGRASLDELLSMRLANRSAPCHTSSSLPVHELGGGARRVLESDGGSVRV